jgi:hypothetical protein
LQRRINKKTLDQRKTYLWNIKIFYQKYNFC